jgi:prolyl-tRNA synthetase
VGLDLTDEQVKKRAEAVYDALKKDGIEVLYDDREGVMAGEKFADYDLIGIPYRLVVSKKSGEQIELKKRAEKETSLISVEKLIADLSKK